MSKSHCRNCKTFSLTGNTLSLSSSLGLALILSVVLHLFIFVFNLHLITQVYVTFHLQTVAVYKHDNAQGLGEINFEHPPVHGF